ncbi:MAG: hypothetical protein ACPGYT_05320 [Nitrospirales bacterium]
MRPLLIFCLFLLLFGLPLLGTRLTGKSIVPFLKFPPTTVEVTPEETAWTLLYCGFVLIILTFLPFLIKLLSVPQQSWTEQTQHPFPSWGWLAFASLIIFWIIAWNRFSWFTEFQLHTFTPLWLSYIVLINAVTSMRTGHCLLLNQPRFFFYLFPLSAGFWWVFEYLNRFVQNWYYLPTREFDALTYFLLGSLSFSTVLPAIYGTYQLLLSFQRITVPFTSWQKVNITDVRGLGWILILLAGIGLIGIGIWPTFLYPLVWTSPLLMMLGFQIVHKQESLLGALQEGDWRPVTTPALAGLICGFLWELWNSQSLAHWEYSLPYLQAFQLFEMPILGYGGYIPFGIECILLIQIFLPDHSR